MVCEQENSTPTDVESLLIKHDILHEKYRQYFLLMLCGISTVLFFDLILSIVDLSGGHVVALVIIFLILMFIIGIVMLGAIINIAFNTNIFFKYSNKYTFRHVPGEEDDHGLLLREI